MVEQSGQHPPESQKPDDVEDQVRHERIVSPTERCGMMQMHRLSQFAQFVDPFGS
jgi:hypothetical protein